jgi:hypothetical protein
MKPLLVGTVGLANLKNPESTGIHDTPILWPGEQPIDAFWLNLRQYSCTLV